MNLEFDLNIAHRLFMEGGKCENIHGHNLDITITITLKDGVDLKQQGFIINFSDIKRAIREEYDHKFIYFEKDELAQTFKNLPGATPVSFNPSTENFGSSIASITKTFDKNNLVSNIRVKVRETINNFCEVSENYD